MFLHITILVVIMRARFTILSKVALLSKLLNQRVLIMKFNAIVRTDLGKGASRRLRLTEHFPAIVYGGEAAPVAITLKHSDIINQMDKPEFYEGFVLVIDGQEVKVKPQDIQRHVYKPKVEHMDFKRI